MNTILKRYDDPYNLIHFLLDVTDKFISLSGCTDIDKVYLEVGRGYADDSEDMLNTRRQFAEQTAKHYSKTLEAAGSITVDEILYITFKSSGKTIEINMPEGGIVWAGVESVHLIE